MGSTWWTVWQTSFRDHRIPDGVAIPVRQRRPVQRNAAATGGGHGPRSALRDDADTNVRRPVSQPNDQTGTVPEDTVPEDTVPEDTVPEDTVPEDTLPKSRACPAGGPRA